MLYQIVIGNIATIPTKLEKELNNLYGTCNNMIPVTVIVTSRTGFKKYYVEMVFFQKCSKFILFPVLKIPWTINF